MTKSVLIVEDEDAILDALAEKISSEGMNALKARDGEEGLAIALKEHPDLVLIDILLPKLSGFDLLKQLREDSWGKKVPIFVVTNLSATDYISKSVELLATGYFIKTDWSMEAIAAQVKAELKTE